MANPHGTPENLRPWKPGQSGNPAGRPRRKSLGERLEALLERCELDGKPLPDGKQLADEFIEVVVKGALAGDAQLIRIVFDRHDGPVGQVIELNANDGGRVVVLPPKRGDGPAGGAVGPPEGVPGE